MADDTNNSAAGAAGAPSNPPASGITQEQLHQAIEKARLEERDKLRTKLDSTQEANTKLTTEVEQYKQAVTKLSEELQALKASLKPEGGVDVTKAIEQAVQAATARFQADNAQVIGNLQAQLEQEKSERNRLTLSQLRVKLIEEAGGVKGLIPELVHGDTEEALKRSIEDSKAVFGRIVSANPAANNTANSNGNAGAGIPNVAIPPSAGANTNPGVVPNPVSVREMSREEYAKNRTALKRQVSGRYASSIITQ